jgi:hypothetical protein
MAAMTLLRLPLLCIAAVAIACGSAPASSTDSPTSPTVPTVPTVPGATPQPATACTTFGDRKVTLNRTVAQFTAAPFEASELRLITNGEETNDPRFAYVWVKESGGSGSANIYAPADGTLIRVRHKVPNSQFNSEDWDFFFLAACDPARPADGDTVFRFNHITHPRADLRAAFSAGSLPAPQVEPTFIEFEERQIPTTNITVRAGELLGSTRGTPAAHDFDFSVAVMNATVCPFDVLPDPHKTLLKNLLGPGPQGPNSSSWGLPQPGYPCRGYGAKP